ncbi:MAG: hypothetical protein J6A45_05460 [Lachnospiraceae bacterium]|nr:hypothetical protein [Lachnospiraceae bacterium]
MEHKQSEEAFQFTYSAKEQEEIKNIRKKYVVQEEDKMEQLRRLDRSVGQKATTQALIVGICGALVLGFGMSLAMTNLGESFGMSEMAALVVGIVIGLCGMVPVALAYPLYNKVLKKERERVAPEILRLSEELMK